MIDRRPAGKAIPASSAGLVARLAGFLLAALLALSVPGTTRDHVDGVFDLHSHDLITGQTVPLVDERGHPTGSQAVSRGIAATPGLFVHAPAAPAAALGEIVLGAIVALAAVLPLAFPVTRDTIRRPLGTVFRPVPPAPPAATSHPLNHQTTWASRHEF